MPAYYNEFDPFAAEWLRNLIDAGHIPAGDVDERSITEVQPDDLDGYTQCHFFAGIGGWPLALRLAGWPDDAPVWTGSCPCQPFSAAGKGRGTDDERHLWPEFVRLISQCRPAITFGEQVASKAGRAWLAGVRAEMEALGYGFGAADLCAAGIGAPHIRQRLFWVAESTGGRHERRVDRDTACEKRANEGGREAEGLRLASIASDSNPRRLGDSSQPRSQGFAGDGTGCVRHEREVSESDRPACPASEAGAREIEGPERERLRVDIGDGRNAWSDCRIIPCRDGKARRVGSAVQPLAYRLPRDVGRVLAGVEGVDTAAIRHARRNRTGRLKGYGNAIVPQVAAEFVRAYMDAN